MLDITARPRLLSVTESIVLPPQPSRRSDVEALKFDFREWFVPPVCFGLLIAAAVVIQW